jgi:protein-S-isoprenylcysteine O-methyltransferase Ste14
MERAAEDDHGRRGRALPRDGHLAFAVASDVLARLAAIGVFGSFLVGDVRRIVYLWPLRVVPALAPTVWRHLATKASSAAFVVLVLALFVVRRRASQKAAGLWPRAAALAGSFFFPAALQALERWKVIAPAEDARLALAGAALVVSGYALALVALAYLGRSFSINAEARRLVTTGPYALVRHPLYLAETLAAAGMALGYASAPAFGALAVHAALQIQRARYEERVLAEAFPAEVEAYRERTPMFVPGLW